MPTQTGYLRANQTPGSLFSLSMNDNPVHTFAPAEASSPPGLNFSRTALSLQVPTVNHILSPGLLSAFRLSLHWIPKHLPTLNFGLILKTPAGSRHYTQIPRKTSNLFRVKGSVHARLNSILPRFASLSHPVSPADLSQLPMLYYQCTPLRASNFAVSTFQNRLSCPCDLYPCFLQVPASNACH